MLYTLCLVVQRSQAFAAPLTRVFRTPAIVRCTILICSLLNFAMTLLMIFNIHIDFACHPFFVNLLLHLTRLASICTITKQLSS